MKNAPRYKIAVIGNPIGHSKSPTLYTTAYQTLGIPIEFEAYDLLPENLPEFVNSIDSGWRGVAITMPHKKAIIPFLNSMSSLAAELQVVNALDITEQDGTLHFHGYNTDVYGIVGAFNHLDIQRAKSMLIIGSGATATSAVAAARELGVSQIRIIARDPERETDAIQFAQQINMQLTIESMTDVLTVTEDLTVITLPNHIADRFTFDGNLAGKALLDVAYEPNPTVITERWKAAGGITTSGLSMLTHQALKQVRTHINGDENVALENEPKILKAMLDALSL